MSFPPFFQLFQKSSGGLFLPAEYYRVDSMMFKEKSHFLVWHSSNQERFWLAKIKMLQLPKKKEVKLLREVCWSYRKEIMRIACSTFREEKDSENVKVYHCTDPFQNTTPAYTCKSRYWFMFLKPNTIAFLSPDGYRQWKKRYAGPSIQS